MTTLILYATKSGASSMCAQSLAKKIPNSFIYDLQKNTPDINNADCVILGSGIRMGHLYKPVRNFIKQNKKTLQEKKVGIYLCNFYPDTLQKAIEKDIPKELLHQLIDIESFGGIPPFKSPQNQDWMKLDHINTMIEKITKQ